MGDQRVDRDALHRYLYERSNSRSQIKVHQTMLAEQLDVTRGTIYRVLKEMVEAGRMRKIESLERNVKVYQITNPDDWAKAQAGYEVVQQPKKIMWG